MGKRKNPAFLEELLIDYVDLDALLPLSEDQSYDLPIEMRQHIMHFSIAKTTLFAQTNSYWRSYHYLQRLQDAVLMDFTEEQEQLLTHLIINSAMLLKEGEKEHLKEGATHHLKQWIYYLNIYYLDKSIDIKNRLLAKALLLIIDNNCSPPQWIEFDFLLNAYCFSVQGKQKQQLYHSLKYLVTRARGMEVPALTLKTLGRDEHVDSVCEAQLLLAQLNGSTWDELGLDSFDKDGYKSIEARGQFLRYIYILHAAVNMIPLTSDFWRSDLKQLISNVVRIYRGSSHSSSFSSASLTPKEYRVIMIAFLDFMMSILRRAPSIEKIWAIESIYNMTSHQLGVYSDLSALETVALLANDDDRIKWLKKLLWTVELNHRLLFLVKRVCARLTTGSAIKEAIFLLRQFHVQHYDQREYYLEDDICEISKLIKSLSLGLKSSSAKRDTAKLLYEMYAYDGFRLGMSFHVAFIPEETYLPRLEEEWNALERLELSRSGTIIDDFCETVTSVERINFWLQRFRPVANYLVKKFIDGSLQDAKHNFDLIAVCYTHLLSKQPDSALLQEWQVNFYEPSIWLRIDRLRMLRNILPSLTHQEILRQWMEILLNALKKQPEELVVAHEVAAIDAFKTILDCINILFPKLSPERQLEYSNQLKAFLFARTLDFNELRYLDAFPVLLSQMPDELIMSLATPESPAALSATQMR